MARFPVQRPTAANPILPEHSLSRSSAATQGHATSFNPATRGSARDAAFRLFTERMGGWWPLATHSVFHAEAVAIAIEPVVGGRVYEATADGRTSDWGTITEWQPGERLAMTWHPGEESELATLVEVIFSEAPDGGTHVDLLHTGWAVHGAEAAARAADYQQGWTALLDGFAKAA